MTAPSVSEIPDAIREHMRGRSWHDQAACPRFEALRLLTLRHVGEDGAVQTGELVVHQSVASEVVAIFERLFSAGFPIHGMQRIDHFAGDDDASMAANNTSAFNFRVVQGTHTLSHHALGLAIDINPLWNPWLRGARVDPPAGRAYLDRAHVRPGMIVPGGVVIEAFGAAGWHWGGAFPDEPDYHHFSKVPRRGVVSPDSRA